MAEPYLPLHDLALCLRAPMFALSTAGGEIDGEGSVQGVFCADKRVLSTARLDLNGHVVEPLTTVDGEAGTVTFHGIARGVSDDQGSDVRVTRVRTAGADGVDERIVLTSTAQWPTEITVRLRVGSDLADMDDVHAARPTESVPGSVDDAGVHWRVPGWRVDVRGEHAGVDADEQALSWRLVVPPGGEAEARWSVRAHDEQPLVRAATGELPWSRPRVRADDPRLERFVDRSLDDLDTMRLTPVELPNLTFIAAGLPWFMRPFARDLILDAIMRLPLGTDLAASALRVLGHYQGQRYDARTGETPGETIHEVSRSAVTLTRGESGTIPPRYWGSIDATPLWMTLLHDAWRWGMPDETVESLMPNLKRALGWLARDADPDRDGFVEHLDASGRGLANQGWKDRYNSIRFRDGSIASAPIALAEVQGYAHEAALGAADLLDTFVRSGAGDRWREYADNLNAAFRRRFWVEDEHGPYPALALDRDKRPADAVASNMGHLLGTGILNEEEARLVTARLLAPDMNSGFGLRTMSALEAAYDPLEYHCGTVWPHDTARAALGMTRQGMASEAAPLVTGLLDAASAFDYRMPELYAGIGKTETRRPVPYPEACRPQAWSAASSIAVVQVLLGLQVDVPRGVVRLSPVAPCPVGHLEVDGLVVGDKRLSVEVDRTGRVVSTSLTQAPGRSPEQRQSSPAIRLQVNDSRAAALSRGRSASVRPRPDQYRDLRRSPERMR